ncbi:cation channel sperm-associated targeting subunit tau [Myotis yumanensis]|uniref:cation channel sperm-associated targeting subunit tau n=1 Tax=Myotis yumanensis TaxID=159337 RepID=UPI0038D11224
MRRKTFTGSESKEAKVTPNPENLVPFGDVVGCLAIHVKNCSHFTPKIDVQHKNNFFIRISINNIVKCTKLCSLLPQNMPFVINERKTLIKFDEVKYFSVQVPRRQNDARNNIYLDLIQFDNKEKHILLGRVQVHLYEVIQKGCFTEEFQMLNENTFVCRMEVDFMFSYGNFGYGFSHQLKPLQKIVEPPMFMNIPPPPERTDPVTNIIIPQSIEYPAFLSPDLKVTVGMPPPEDQPNQPPAVRLEKLQQQPRERLEKMKKEYRDLPTWREKAAYLEGILNPKLGPSEPKESDTYEVPESQFEKKPEDTVTSDISHIKKEVETIPTELLGNDDKKGLTLPTLNQQDGDNSKAFGPKRDEPAKQRAAPLFTIPNLTITEGNKMIPLEEHQYEPVTDRKLLTKPLQPEGKLLDKHPSILKRESSTSQSSYGSFSMLDEYVKLPGFIHELMQDKNCGWLNTNKKGKTVAFLQKQYMLPPLKPEHTESKTKYQNLNTKDSLDPFLRLPNNKISATKRSYQDMSKYRNTLSTEVIEHEDQDPPYPTHSKSPSPTDTNRPSGLDSSIVDAKTVDTKKKLAPDPDIITIQTLSSKNNLDCEPTITTIKSLDIKNHLKERLPTASLPNFEGESSLTGNVDVNTGRLSRSLSFTSLLDNLKQSVVLKPNLSKNLEDLLDKLLFKPKIPNGTEGREKSHSSPLTSVHDKPPTSLEDKILEKIQDLNNWLSEGDILNSESPVNPKIKGIPGVSLSEDGPGNSTEVERDLLSENHLEDGDIAFPIIKKSSFKKKHLESEVSSPEPDFNSIAHDYIIKQIFTAPFFSKLAMGVEELSETQMNWQNQLPTSWESLSSNIPGHYEENDDGRQLPEAKSVASQIIEAFSVDTLLESGIIKVVELGEDQKGSLLHTETAFAGEKPKDSTEGYSEIKSKTDFLSKQNIPIIPKETTSFLNRATFIDKGQNTSPQDTTYQSTPDEKTDLPSNGQRLDREENDLSSTLENLSTLLMGKLNEPDVTMLKSFFKNIFNVFLEHNQSEKRRQPEKELERLIQHPFLNNAEDLEEIKENFDEADKLDKKPNLNPKLGVFPEALSESEIEKFKAEVSKYIQHYLVERLSESGHITKEDLPKIYQNLYLINEKTEPKEQNISLEKYSEIVKEETMSSVNNFNHHFIDKNLEIRLRSFLNEILQNYFLKNLSESSLFKETESEPMHSNIPSRRTKSSSISFHELGQDISKGSFGRRLEINMKYPVNKSLQNHLIGLSENELLNLKADLRKYLQALFIDKLSKSGLITERQLKGISKRINLIKSSSTPLKCIKPDLSFRDENKFMNEHSEKQNKYPKVVHKATLQKAPEDRIVETELTRNDEKEYFPLQNTKENPAIIREQKTLTLIKVQPSSNKNTQAIPSKKSSERPTDIVLKKQRKAHGFVQLSEAEDFDFKAEIQNSHSRSGKSEITQSNTCFESTLKMKSLEKKEQSIYKLMVQETHEVLLPPNVRIPYYQLPSEDEEDIGKFTFPPGQRNTLTHLNSEAGNTHCQRLKGYNNNNKKQHLETLAHSEQEIQTLYIKPSEICNEKCAKVLESFKYKVVEAEKNSKPSLFPEVLKRGNVKPKVRKERDCVNKQTKSPKTVKVLAPTPPTRKRPRKSVPRTLLHWTARRTIHDCSDRFEDFPMTPFQHLEKVKSRARLLEKNPDESHDRLKHARPCTAPGVNKHRESYTGKFTSSRMVSAGLVHLNDTVPDYEIHKTQPKIFKRKC